MSLDRVSNMLSTIKNASMSKKRAVEVVYTKQCESIAKVLLEKGFLTDVKVFKPKDLAFKKMDLELSKDGKTFNFTDMQILSKPGRRVYKKSQELGKSKGGFGLFIVSTSRGIIDGETARKKKLGGELICEVF